jgi:hypothetical protein
MRDMRDAYDARSAVGFAGAALTLICERCGHDLLEGRPHAGWFLEHLQAIAGLHYEREHADLVLP